MSDVILTRDFKTPYGEVIDKTTGTDIRERPNASSIVPRSRR